MCLQEVQQDHYHDWFLPKLSTLGKIKIILLSNFVF